MVSVTLSCPQCGAPLPRQASWRTVTCLYCKADVTRCEEMVRASWFHDLYRRAQAHVDTGVDCLRFNGRHYKVIAPLGIGMTARIVLAERLGSISERVVFKLAHASTESGRLKHEAESLKRLQREQSSGAAYFSQRLPQPIAHGQAVDTAGHEYEALVLRSPTGFWGSLAQVKRNYPNGIDPRHAVWMWRRILEVLHFVHQAGWAHGNLAPEHWLVHPRNHGIMLIGWSDAQQFTRSSKNIDRLPNATLARDLMQSAWTMRAMLASGDDEPTISTAIPSSLASVLKNASEDLNWCAKLGANGLDEELKAAARTAFGAPRFVEFTPSPKGDSF